LPSECIIIITAINKAIAKAAAKSIASLISGAGMLIFEVNIVKQQLFYYIYSLTMRILPFKYGWSSNAPVSAGASVDISEELITVDFAVREAPSCFCQTKEQDGEAVWEDSCVEVFLKLPWGKEYLNFEFNSKGICYAARGENRENRKEFSKSEYAQIIRKPSGVTEDGKFYRWMLSVQIPSTLLGNIKDLRIVEVEGNLYKCADLAPEPHWLTAFPINNAPKPDFHRPEAFLPFIPFVDK